MTGMRIHGQKVYILQSFNNFQIVLDTITYRDYKSKKRTCIICGSECYGRKCRKCYLVKNPKEIYKKKLRKKLELGKEDETRN